MHQPFQHVQVVRGETELESTTAATLIDWFLERPGLNDRPRPAGPGRTLVLPILRALARYQNQWRRTYLDSRHSDEQKASNPARYEENERELARDRQELLDLGVEMPERGTFS